MIGLVKASIKDCVELHNLQIKAFKELLDKYHDIKTNPGAETLERIISRMNQEFIDYYFIQIGSTNIGAIRIVTLAEYIFRISPIFLLPEFQGKGYAQQAIKEVEKLYPKAKGWQLYIFANTFHKRIIMI